MRKVIVYEYKKIGDDTFVSKVTDGKGYATLHGWGCDYEEFETGPGNYSTAIIEREDGTVENVHVEMVKFVDA